MEGWWIFLFLGLLFGFILGGEYRHRLWNKNDRYWTEQTIKTLREHVKLLQDEVQRLRSMMP